MFATARTLCLTLALATALVPAATPVSPARAEAARDGVDVVGSVVSLAPLHISVVRDGKIRGILTLTPNLDVTDTALRDRVAREYPRLRDSYLRALDPYIDRLDVRAAPDVVQMTRLLQRATDGLYGDGTVTVMIIHATLRRLG
ncbi:hypothetical protein [Zavarzinia sp.]|uniref:hypothetical protein n=1 Tax=Zavarzinia sp. TaxID=2027920 RepID=UPI0035634146